MMNMREAIQARHSVRGYTPRPIEAALAGALQKSISEINDKAGLHFQLVLEEPHAFSGMLSYGTFKGVRNYIVAAGKRQDDVAEKIGYYGERLVLEAVAMGLGTCWVGLTFRKTADAFVLDEGEKVYCVIALGYYGDGNIKTHKVKPLEKVSNVSDLTPGWFRQGVESALLAPTAVNQQKFFFEYRPKAGTGKPVVAARKMFSLIGYTGIDLGIAKCHFEIGAGKENFEWAVE